MTVVAAGVTVLRSAQGARDLADEWHRDSRHRRLFGAADRPRRARRGGQATGGRVITVEDHYAQGGLGDAVAEAVWDQAFRVKRLAVREIPRSGPPADLLDRYGISARAIVDAVRELASSMIIARHVAPAAGRARGVFSAAALARRRDLAAAPRGQQDPAVDHRRPRSRLVARTASASPSSWFDADLDDDAGRPRREAARREARGAGPPSAIRRGRPTASRSRSARARTVSSTSWIAPAGGGAARRVTSASRR